MAQVLSLSRDFARHKSRTLRGLFIHSLVHSFALCRWARGSVQAWTAGRSHGGVLRWSPGLFSACRACGEMNRYKSHHLRIRTSDIRERAVPNKQRVRAQGRGSPCMSGLRKASCTRSHLSRTSSSHRPQGQEPHVMTLIASPVPNSAHPSASSQKADFNSGYLLRASTVHVLWETVNSPKAHWHLPFMESMFGGEEGLWPESVQAG